MVRILTVPSDNQVEHLSGLVSITVKNIDASKIYDF